MALTLVVEDGTGLSNSNSYVSVSEADAYNDAHIERTLWAALSTADKEAALAMATRVIDESYQFNGSKNGTSQALQWPRRDARNPDDDDTVYPVTLSYRDNEFPNDEIPKLLKNATIQLAREFVLSTGKGDTVSGFHQGVGIKKVELSEFVSVEFDKSDKRHTIPQHVMIILSKLGRPLFGNRMVQMIRA